MKRTLLWIASIGGIVALLYGQLLYWNDPFVGWILFFAYVALFGSLWRDMLARVFRMKRRRSVTVVFGFFAAFALLGLVGGMFTTLYTLTPLLVWLCYVLAAAGTLLVFLFMRRAYKKKVPGVALGKRWRKLPRDWKVFRGYHVLSLVYLLLSISLLAFFLLSRSDATLSSPWQALSPAVLPLWFVLTLLLGFLLFSKFKIKTLLVFVLIHSCLTHIYLPISHVLPWGGDVWRHVAVEQKMISGELQLPVIAGPQAKWREVLNADIPEALVIPNKYVYGQFWATTIILAETLRIDLLTLNIWLLPILWSLVLPFIFFRLGKLLFGSWRNGLWLSWFGTLLFPFQALGGLTLPVSLGVLMFLFVLTLWLQYQQDGRRAERRIVLLFAGLMIFGYTLFTVLLWFFMALSFFVRRAVRIQKRFVRWPIFGLLVLVSIALFPLIELTLGISTWPAHIDWFAEAKQMFGQFSGWYYAQAIRPHDILSGNIFFNHTPVSAFVSTFFTDWRWHVIPALGLIFGMAAYGFFQLIQKEDTTEWRVLGYFSGAVCFGYIFNWFVLTGDRSFVRRLDLMFACCVLLFFFRGFFALRVRIGAGSQKKKRAGLAAAIILFSWFGATAYASGPDMRVVSNAQYHVAQAATQMVSSTPACVLADTWVLLPLEGLSAGRIVGGGFPIDAQFGQTERTNLFSDMLADPKPVLLDRIKKATGADTCIFIAQKSRIDTQKAEILQDLADKAPEDLYGYHIWQFPLKNTNEGDSL